MLKRKQHVESFQPQFLLKEAIILLSFYFAQTPRHVLRTRRSFHRPPRPATLPFHLSFPLTASLPFCCHGPSSVRGEHSCRDSRPLGLVHPLPGLIHFLTQHVQGHVTSSCHLCQPHTRCGGRHTFVFQPSFAFTLPHWTVWAAHFPFVPQTGDSKSISISSLFRHYVQGDERTLLKDISREKGGGAGRMSGLMKGLKVSLFGAIAGSF